jgi:rhamnopyranosyl-N-acetylglucosaminyl-diphospho-decaprenol beta-1,3/1,4-galactofuranosyltransferase
MTLSTSHRGSVVAIVVTHNRLSDLKLCLAALRAQTYQPESLIVVDNASTDDTPAFLAQQSDLTVIRLHTNAGGAGGFKAGMDAAATTRSAWWWLMDDDCVPAADALDRLARACVNSESRMLAGAAPTVQYADGITRCGLIWPHQSLRPVHHIDGRVDWAPFLGLLLSAVACRSVGPVRDDFFINGDDTEYCMRLHYNGWHLVGAPNAVVMHPPITGGPAPAWKEYYRVRNSVVVAYMTDATTTARARTTLIWSVREMKRVLILARHLRANRIRIWMRLRGLTDAVLGRMGPRVLPEASPDENA